MITNYIELLDSELESIDELEAVLRAVRRTNNAETAYRLLVGARGVLDELISSVKTTVDVDEDEECRPILEEDPVYYPLPTEEVAKILGVCVNSVLRFRRQGLLEGTRYGHTYVFTHMEVCEFVHKHASNAIKKRWSEYLVK